MTVFMPYTEDELLEQPWLPLARVEPGLRAFRSERGVEVLTYDGCATLLRDVSYTTGLGELFDVSGVNDTSIRALATESVNYVEGSTHTRLRAAIGSFFTPARVESMRQEVRTGIEAALDALDGVTELDLVDQMIRDVPSTLFARLLGVDPVVHRDFISRISEESVRVFEMNPTLAGDVTAAWGELVDWVDELIAIHSPGAPEKNVLDHLLAAQVAGKLSDREIKVSLVTLLAASTDTTQILAGCMFWAFIENPDQWDRLRSDPSLAASAVTESARYRPGDAWIFRVATVDGELEGVPVAAGDHVFACIGAAHRDPSVFDDAHSFDIGRRAPRMPLNWGVGRHFCLGRMFAVMELEEMLLATANRWSALEHRDAAKAATASYLSVQQQLPVRIHWAH